MRPTLTMTSLRRFVGRERLELVRYRPSRRLRHRSQGALLLARVHLHDDAVDLVLERLPLDGPPRTPR